MCIMEIIVCIVVGVVFLAACFLVIRGGQKSANQEQSSDAPSNNGKLKSVFSKKKDDHSEDARKTAEDIVFSKREMNDDKQHASGKNRTDRSQP